MANDAVSVAGRFWLGVVLPHLTIAAVTLVFIVLGGGGLEWSPLLVFLLSLVAFPMGSVVGCWILFVRWKRKLLLVAAGSLVPALTAFALAWYMTSPRRDADASGAVLAPVLHALRHAGEHPLAFVGAWLAALVILNLSARSRA
jgi:hypothetical protein